MSREAIDFMISTLSLPPVGFFKNYLLWVIVLSIRKLKPCGPGVPAYVYSVTFSEPTGGTEENGTILVLQTFSDIKMGTCRKKVFMHPAGAMLQGTASLADSPVSSPLCCRTVFSGIPP